MSESTTSEYVTGIRRAQAGEVLAVAQCITSGRKVAYNLTPETPAYDHMVTEMLRPEGLAELELLVNREGGFAVVAETSQGNIGGVAIGKRDDENRTDRFEYFFMSQQFQGGGWGGHMIGQFCSWAIYRQLVWVVEDNRRARALYDRHGFGPYRRYRDRAIGMRFIGMQRHEIGGTTQ